MLQSEPLAIEPLFMIPSFLGMNLLPSQSPYCVSVLMRHDLN